MKTIKRILMLIMTLKSIETAASVPDGLICVAPKGSQVAELNLKYIGELHALYHENNFSRYMPTNVSKQDNEFDFATKWLAHLSSVLDTEDFRKSSIGQMNKSIRTPVSTNLSIFKMSVKPLLGEAKIQWESIVNGQVRLDALKQTVTVELSRALSTNTKFVVSHLSHNSESLNKIALNYSF